jgi:hypothetical protein
MLTASYTGQEGAMPRARYQFTAADVPVVHRWVQAKLRDPTWPQPTAAHTAREQLLHDQPTAPQLQQWCTQYLAAPQWAQLQAVIRAARRDAGQTRTVRLSTRAHTLLHALAQREQRTLSETLERHLASVLATSAPQDTPPPTAPTPQPPAVTGAKRGRPATTAPTKQGCAFITTKKGGCYLTVKVGRHNCSLMRIRNYTIDTQDKRDMRRLHPDVTFDWQKIARQLVAKREVCRRYRVCWHAVRVPRVREPFYGVFEPHTRRVYVNDPDDIAGVSGLLDAILARER